MVRSMNKSVSAIEAHLDCSYDNTFVAEIKRDKLRDVYLVRIYGEAEDYARPVECREYPGISIRRALGAGRELMFVDCRRYLGTSMVELFEGKWQS